MSHGAAGEGVGSLGVLTIRMLIDGVHVHPCRSCYVQKSMMYLNQPESIILKIPNMKPYIEYIGTLQNCGFWLVKGKAF